MKPYLKQNEGYIMDKLWELVIKNAGDISDDLDIMTENKNDIDLIDDLGYDSLRLITLIVSIESYYDIEFDDRYLFLDVLRKINSIENVVKLGGRYEEE